MDRATGTKVFETVIDGGFAGFLGVNRLRVNSAYVPDRDEYFVQLGIDDFNGSELGTLLAIASQFDVELSIDGNSRATLL